MNIPSRIIRTAHNLALNAAPVRDQRMVAIIYDKRYIEAVGIAAKKTHPLAKLYSKYEFLHAEIDAICSAMRHTTSPNRKFALKDCSIYVHRVRSADQVGLAKPCANCMAALTQIFHLKQISWSISGTYDNPQIGST